MLFQIVRLEISADGSVLARQETQPVFELRQDAMAMAEFEAMRCYDECEIDAEHNCWTVHDNRGQTFRLLVEPIKLETEMAA
jgi:hypothetical protein